MHTFFSVKSRGQAIPSGYSPEAYPMGAVAPVAPIAALPSDDQQIKVLHVYYYCQQLLYYNIPSLVIIFSLLKTIGI